MVSNLPHSSPFEHHRQSEVHLQKKTRSLDQRPVRRNLQKSGRHRESQTDRQAANKNVFYDLTINGNTML